MLFRKNDTKDDEFTWSPAGTSRTFLSQSDKYRTFSCASELLTLIVRASKYSLHFESLLAAREWPWKFGIRPLQGLKVRMNFQVKVFEILIFLREKENVFPDMLYVIFLSMNDNLKWPRKSHDISLIQLFPNKISDYIFVDDWEGFFKLLNWNSFFKSKCFFYFKALLQFSGAVDGFVESFH